MTTSLESQIHAFAQEYAATLPAIDTEDITQYQVVSSVVWRRRRVRLVAMAVAVGVVLLLVLSPILQRNDTVLATVAFPDGTEIRIDPLFALDDEDALDDFESRLAEYGVVLVIDSFPVNPEADGRIYEIEFGAPLKPDPSGTVIIPADAAGAVIRVTVGVGDADAGIEGLRLFEVYPELCRAIDPFDTNATQAALAELGVSVEWHLLIGVPDGTGGGLSSTEPAEPPEGKIISVLTAEGSNLAPAQSPTTLSIEVIPLDANWHEPLNPNNCAQE
jgi:hypothetical protein